MLIIGRRFCGSLTPLSSLNRLAVPVARSGPGQIGSPTTYLSAMSKLDFLKQNLTTSSPCPPITPGLIRIYSNQMCPYVERVRLVLQAKNIPFEQVDVNLAAKPEWLIERNPTGKVPALEWDGKILNESLVIADFLDESFPKARRLHPADPYQKARDRMLAEQLSGSLTRPFVRLLKTADFYSEIRDHFDREIKSFEAAFAERGTRFLGGADRPGMVDYMAFPWVERAPACLLVLGHTGEVIRQRYPTFTAYREAMLADEAVAKVALSDEVHRENVVNWAIASRENANPSAGDSSAAASACSLPPRKP